MNNILVILGRRKTFALVALCGIFMVSWFATAGDGDNSFPADGGETTCEHEIDPNPVDGDCHYSSYTTYSGGDVFDNVTYLSDDGNPTLSIEYQAYNIRWGGNQYGFLGEYKIIGCLVQTIGDPWNGSAGDAQCGPWTTHYNLSGGFSGSFSAAPTGSSGGWANLDFNYGRVHVRSDDVDSGNMRINVGWRRVHIDGYDPIGLGSGRRVTSGLPVMFEWTSTNGICCSAGWDPIVFIDGAGTPMDDQGGQPLNGSLLITTVDGLTSQQSFETTLRVWGPGYNGDNDGDLTNVDHDGGGIIDVIPFIISSGGCSGDNLGFTWTEAGDARYDLWQVNSGGGYISTVASNISSGFNWSQNSTTGKYYRARAYKTLGGTTYQALSNIRGPYACATYSLSVTRSGTGSGSIGSSPAGISCPADCSQSYDSGTSVTLTPSASPGSVFAGWSGACSGAGPCVIVMNSNKTADAIFNAVAATYTLNVNRSPAAGGNVTSSPGGISCGSDCSQPYGDMTTVTLTASPNSGYTFANWSGACSGSGACNITMNSDKSVTANFNAVAVTHNLTVTKSGLGTVISSPSGINCGVACSSSFPDLAPVTLTATPDAGYGFDHWEGAASGCATNVCPITMDGPKAVLAVFTSGAPPTPPSGLTVTCDPAGTQVTLTWNKVFGATNYRLRVDNKTNNPYGGMLNNSCTDGWYCNPAFDIQMDVP